MDKFLLTIFIFRLLIDYIVLVNNFLPQFIKILLIMITDNMDCIMLWLPNIYQKFTSLPTNSNYQLSLHSLTKSFKDFILGLISLANDLDAGCGHKGYDIADKITDIISASLLYWQIYQNKLLEESDLKFITYLFIFRLIGISLYFITKNTNFLVYFPNFFFEISLIIFTIKYFNKDYTNLKNYKYSKIILFIVGILKIIQEIVLHRFGMQGIKQFTLKSF
jgi:hypothetical protein